MVLWVCDQTFSYWTKQCILHADLILIVASIDENYTPHLEEKINEIENLRTPQHLVLLHKEHLYVPPENTALWLQERKWISDFHHIRCHQRIYRDEFHKSMLQVLTDLTLPLLSFFTGSRFNSVLFSIFKDRNIEVLFGDIAGQV
ncbi:hypothetical protein HZS_4057 [Henneguya salminicola]|nr:hypothetical protein HZS_4057 [Henneguya salminicola]